MTLRFTKLMISVEVRAGTSIEIAADQMIGLAKELEIGIKTSFNGINLNAWPETTVQNIIDNYNFERNLLTERQRYAIATGQDWPPT